MSKNSRANKAIAAKVNAVVKSTKAKAQPHPCGCLSHVAYRVTAADIPESDAATFVEYDVLESCGGETVREFLPGHDAKLKSTLIKAHLAGEDIAFLDGPGTLVHVAPMQLAKNRGWEKFLIAAANKQGSKVASQAARAEARAVAKANKPAKVKPTSKKAAPAATKTEQKAADAKAAAKTMVPRAGSYPVRVKIGRMVHDANITAEGVNEVTVTYKRRQGGALIDTTTVVKRSQLVA